MKVAFAQADFPFAEKTTPLVKRVVSRLKMTRKLQSVMIDVVDFGPQAAKNPADSIEVYSNGGVRLHLKFDHFLKEKHRRDPRKRDLNASFHASAFDSASTLEVLFRLLLQWRDVQDWGIPENQDEEFLCLWNVHVAGRLDRMDAPCASKTAHWEEFLRIFAGGQTISEYLVIFEVLWKCDDLGMWGLNDMLYRLRASRLYRPLHVEKTRAR
jgi:hypothetical protein